MAENEEETLLKALDGEDWGKLRDAAEEAGDWLRTRHIDDRLRNGIAERLLRLSSHPKWEVRLAVAHALLYLRHETFHAAIARIVEDDNAWVREAARKTLQRRSELTRADIMGNDRGDAILELLTDLEIRHGRGARKAALRLADRLQLEFVRQAYHEIVRIISPLDASLINLEKEIADIPGVPVRSLSHVRRARDRVALLTDILDNLRAFATEATGEFSMEEILPILKEAEELALSNVERPVAGLRVRHDVDASLKIEAHRSRLLEALINIIINAVEACIGLDREAELTIGARRHSESHVAITVADNGCGMSEEALGDCVRLHSTGKPNGMGFGLPLAKKIVENDHQGSLIIDSRLGEGTTVTLLLPIEQVRTED